ncbi:MAG: IS4 family transposase [Actinomycetota bacterium]
MASPFTRSSVSCASNLDPSAIHRFVENLVGEDLHARRVFSLARGVIGVLRTASLAIHAIGSALALTMGLLPKHATKQVDRLLSNEGLDLNAVAPTWVKFVLAARTEAVVAMDWTDFDPDGQTTLVLAMMTDHGRATPLLWKTVDKATLKNHRNDYEDDLLRRLREAVPETVRITVLADRGFGDQKLYEYLKTLKFDFVIRFKGNIAVTSASGVTQSAKDWLHARGTLRSLRHVTVTQDQTPVAQVVIVRAAGMKDPWYLASSRDDLSGAEIKKLYGRRFTIEETFRDTKDLHFGLGLSSTHIKIPARRDRLLLLVALAETLLTLLGAAGESIGMDRAFKRNTVTKRTLSLFRQGSYWYSAIPAMGEERLRDLMTAFGEMLKNHEVFNKIFGAI